MNELLLNGLILHIMWTLIGLMILDVSVFLLYKYIVSNAIVWGLLALGVFISIALLLLFNSLYWILTIIFTPSVYLN